MATVADTHTLNTTDPDEQIVEEVHCSECNVPMPAIPSWYAKVNTRFTCDNCRQKSPRLAVPSPAAESSTGVSGSDVDFDSASDEEGEDVDLDLDEEDTADSDE